MFSIEIMVDEELVDPAYNHVHHARSLLLLERARGALLESIGFPNEQLLQEGKVIVVTSLSVAYKREVKAGMVTVTCSDAWYDRRTITVNQTIISSNSKTLVEATVNMMFMDVETRRGKEAPADFLAALLNKQGVS